MKCPCNGGVPDYSTQNGRAIVGCALHNRFHFVGQEPVVVRERVEVVRREKPVSPRRIFLLSDDEAIARLAELGKALGRTPKAEELEKSQSVPGRSFFVRRFGSLQAAVEKAGLTYRPRGKAKALGRISVWKRGNPSRPKKVEADLPNGWRVAS